MTSTVTDAPAMLGVIQLTRRAGISPSTFQRWRDRDGLFPPDGYSDATGKTLPMWRADRIEELRAEKRRRTDPAFRREIGRAGALKRWAGHTKKPRQPTKKRERRDKPLTDDVTRPTIGSTSTLRFNQEDEAAIRRVVQAAWRANTLTPKSPYYSSPSLPYTDPALAGESVGAAA